MAVVPFENDIIHPDLITFLFDLLPTTSKRRGFLLDRIYSTGRKKGTDRSRGILEWKSCRVVRSFKDYSNFYIFCLCFYCVFFFPIDTCIHLTYIIGEIYEHINISNVENTAKSTHIQIYPT